MVIYWKKEYASDLFQSWSKESSTVSLDSLDNEVFQKMSGKKFNVNEVIKGISKAKSEGFKNIKINTVTEKGVNEKVLWGLLIIVGQRATYSDLLNIWMLEH